MLIHEFGIMQSDPLESKRYDDYEPEKYNCIIVYDKDILLIVEYLRVLKTYWHTLENPNRGLAYLGTTIIPPSSFELLLSILCLHDRNTLVPLIERVREANKSQKYIIHFGI